MHYIERSTGNDASTKYYTLGNCYWLVGKILLMQDNTCKSNLSSNRLVFASVLLAAVCIYYNWEAMLISHIAVRTIKLPFKTLDDLAQAYDYKVWFYT